MRETILLVEDEPVLCHLMEGVLEASGFTVVTAANLEEAFAHLEGREPFHVLVADLHLETESSVPFIEQACTRDPSLRVIVTTGGECSTPDLPWLVLEKPFCPSELVAAVCRVLSQ
ncbi:MAG TPA: response regulator [Acidobacteriota bacterium]|nr:response regulator [Acidobacteriota bacterium]